MIISSAQEMCDYCVREESFFRSRRKKSETDFEAKCQSIVTVFESHFEYLNSRAKPPFRTLLGQVKSWRSTVQQHAQLKQFLLIYDRTIGDFLEKFQQGFLQAQASKLRQKTLESFGDSSSSRSSGTEEELLDSKDEKV